MSTLYDNDDENDNCYVIEIGETNRVNVLTTTLYIDSYAYRYLFDVVIIKSWIC